jgi:streptomycin 6-kinase
MLNEYLTRWDLTPNGASIVTRGSRLLPVRQHGAPAMLKVAVHAEEKFGGLVMAWWDGDGAARVLAHDRDAILLERATEGTSLADLARNGHDDEATRIICAVAGKLHTPRSNPPRGLIPLAQWFSDLEPASAQYGGILRLAAATARGLLSAPRDSVVLHGDIHHGNILDFGPRGWLAIDPKGLIGERGFDYANVSAIRTTRARRRLPALGDRWTWSPSRQGSSAGACCNGSWPGRAFRPCGPSTTACRRTPLSECSSSPRQN